MDHSSDLWDNKKYAESAKSGSEDFDAYVTEDGRRFRVPYRMIKRVVFTNLKKTELIDIPHSARLQYRLMLLDPVIKARVDYTKAKIMIMYNPSTADNHKEKISLEELIQLLEKEGVHVSTTSTDMVNEDYDYYKNFYSYAYNPPSIRESTPYGYTREQWQKMKPQWQEKMKKGNEEKLQKFRNFQENYLEEHPEIAQKIVPGFKPSERKLTFKEKLFGRKGKEGGKGFWFHGV